MDKGMSFALSVIVLLGLALVFLSIEGEALATLLNRFRAIWAKEFGSYNRPGRQVEGVINLFGGSRHNHK